MPHIADPPVNERPVYWFVLLEQAIDRSDFEAAARAKQELERLGIRITYRPRRQRQEPNRAQ
jgi:hypothetical protein